MEEPLIMWTVYDHPTDFPEVFVARKFRITSLGGKPTPEVIMAPDLYDLRIELSELGLAPMERHATDDPKIVETWL